MAERKAKPQEWQFNDEDRRRYDGKFWKAPRRLVEEGLLSSLWRREGTSRGGGGATSLLPVLAVHTWPGKKDMDGAPAAADDSGRWTGWTSLSSRRTAKLAGIARDTATSAFRQLESAGLLQRKRVPRDPSIGGFRSYFRLAASLYPSEREPYASVPASLFYSGSWAILPTSAARHLFLVISLLDQVGDEASYLAKIRADDPAEHGPWWDYDDVSREWWDRYGYEEIDQLLALKFLGENARRPLSLSALQHASGLPRPTVVEALRVLTTPVFGDCAKDGTDYHYPPIAMVAKGDAADRVATWYAPDRRALRWRWTPEFLNDRGGLSALRRKYWPWLHRSRSAAKLRAKSAAIWRFNGKTNAEIRGLVVRLRNDDLSAWDEAVLLGELRARLAEAGRELTGPQLGQAVGRRDIVVNELLRIQREVRPETTALSGLSDSQLRQLPRAALLRIAKTTGRAAQARLLQEELRITCERTGAAQAS